jgi:hypothetical protein
MKASDLVKRAGVVGIVESAGSADDMSPQEKKVLDIVESLMRNKHYESNYDQANMVSKMGVLAKSDEPLANKMMEAVDNAMSEMSCKKDEMGEWCVSKNEAMEGDTEEMEDVDVSDKEFDMDCKEEDDSDCDDLEDDEDEDDMEKYAYQDMGECYSAISELYLSVNEASKKGAMDKLKSKALKVKKSLSKYSDKIKKLMQSMTGASPEKKKAIKKKIDAHKKTMSSMKASVGAAKKAAKKVKKPLKKKK